MNLKKGNEIKVTTTQKNIRMREKWIDCLKGVAIIAVVIDHLYGVLYVQKEVQYATFFSVTMFVFLGGVNSFFSCKKHLCEGYFYDISRRLFHILFPYAIAVGLYQFQADKFLDLGKYFKSLISFSGLNLFYFLIFYIQLVAISRLIYYIIDAVARMKFPLVGYTGVVCGSIIVAFFSLHYTSIPLQEGQTLFGGSYLVVFICGMLFAKYKGNVSRENTKWWRLIIYVIAVVCCYKFMLNNDFSIDRLLRVSEINPPGVTICLYSACVIIMLMSLCVLIEKKEGWCQKVYNVICRCGKYSYYIYLFHMLFILVLLHKVLEVYELNIWISRIITIIISVGGPIVLGVVIEKLMLFMKGKYNVEEK